MQVIGAINIYNGCCIDSIEDRFNFVENCNPRELAVKWNNIGVNYIHFVDVNSYKYDESFDIGQIKEIFSKIAVPFEVSAKIDNIETFEEIIAAGASRVVIDNRSLENIDFVKELLLNFEDKVVILFNTHSGITEIKQNYHESVIDITKDLTKSGLRRVIYRDISDNYEFNYDDFFAYSNSINIPVIACGKLTSLESIKKLKRMAERETAIVEGILLSKPLYDNTLDLYEVIKLIEAYPFIGDFYSREDIC